MYWPIFCRWILQLAFGSDVPLHADVSANTSTEGVIFLPTPGVISALGPLRPSPRAKWREPDLLFGQVGKSLHGRPRRFGC